MGKEYIYVIYISLKYSERKLNVFIFFFFNAVLATASITGSR